MSKFRWAVVTKRNFLQNDPVVEQTRDEGRDPGVGVHDVEIPLRDQLFQSPVGTEDRTRLLGVEGQGDAADPGGLGFPGIDSAEGREGHGVPPGHQLAAELEDVGLRPADVHGHGYHQDFHDNRSRMIELMRNPVCDAFRSDPLFRDEELAVKGHRLELRPRHFVQRFFASLKLTA